VSTVAVKHHNQHHNSNHADYKNLSKAIAMVANVKYSRLKIILKIWILKNGLTNIWSIEEASADGIHDSLSFHLATVCAVIDHDRWNNISTMLVPVVDFILDNLVLSAITGPLLLITGAKALVHAILGALPVQFVKIFMCVF